MGWCVVKRPGKIARVEEILATTDAEGRPPGPGHPALPVRGVYYHGGGGHRLLAVDAKGREWLVDRKAGTYERLRHPQEAATR